MGNKDSENSIKAPVKDGRLRFFARSNLLVTVPDLKIGVRYVGRTWDKELGGWRADSAPYLADPESEAGKRLADLCRKEKSLWAADQYTATRCRVPFVKTQHVDGEHVPAKGA